MHRIDIAGWVKDEQNPKRRPFREAVHVILEAIAEDPELAGQMLMKGGMLLAIGYNSKRFTKDIDFSTDKMYADFDKEPFENRLNALLEISGDRLDYNLACKIQRCKPNPKSEKASFQTLKISIGYAKKNNRNQILELNRKKSSNVVTIDYSFNELKWKVESLYLEGGKAISAYSIIDLISEKYRAMLQQVVRNRSRRQDAYDLFFLIKNIEISDDDKRNILKVLIKKASSRGLDVSKLSISAKGVISRSKKEYYTLQDEFEDDLPDFEEVYGLVREFYESLPWPLT
jgi:predicted nucleotidyltransferase component of viral defense system